MVAARLWSGLYSLIKTGIMGRQFGHPSDETSGGSRWRRRVGVERRYSVDDASRSPFGRLEALGARSN